MEQKFVFLKGLMQQFYVVACILHSWRNEVVIYGENEEMQFHALCYPEFANAKPRDTVTKTCVFVWKKLS